VITRPSEIVRRQMYVNFWFEAEGIKLRMISVSINIMWESDFPHVASYLSAFLARGRPRIKGVPEADRCKMHMRTPCGVYKIDAVLPAKCSQICGARSRRTQRGRPQPK